MKQNNNAEYWHKRFELLEKAEYNKSAEYVKYLEKIYGQAISNCEAEIAKWYQRIAVNNAITYQEAKKLLSRDELKEFRWSIEEYIKYGETNGVLSDWSKELENVSAKVHISRLEAMKIQMQQQVEIVIAKQAESISILLNDIYKDSYYRSIFEFQKGFGVGSSFSILDDKTVAKILSKPWTADNRTFSQRIWGKHRPELIDKLQKDLAQNFIAGENPQKLVAKITKDFGVTKSQASNLAFTESAFFRSAGQKKSYQELGVDEYEILATLDNRTPKICPAQDGKVFKTSDLQVGINPSTVHGGGRTTSVPILMNSQKDETRAARDENGKYYTVPADMKYPEWKSKYVDEPKEKEYNKFKEQVKKNIKENYNLSLNKGQQDKHIVGTNNYIEGRSILTADPQELIDMYAGEGFFFQKRNGDWKERTWFEHDDVIGKYIDKDGNSIETTKGIIHYSKRKGVHVVPSNPKGEYMI